MKTYKQALVNVKFWLFLLLLGVAIVVAVLLSKRGESITATPSPQSEAQVVHQPVQAAAIEELSLTLNQKGFEPAELIPNGRRFLLSVDNRTDVKAPLLKLSDKNGKFVRELRVPEGAGDWGELFELKSGKYVLSEANHAAWSCSIVIN